ncbi:MAG TPA: methionyl-tRNA formyltransferase [Candidatus Eisenbergiella merdipullorum]|uniref:Methionyl-tRNA formyltransferase n=1 Tax=Candidatus Eisenbergiella merdipullorum TaxID=2838553 RepID=A0A9D2I7N3_9FIRM|nr:methionyl-tRNA formyltransferase [Candidatus Eisenbergiella merdipullorum]
MKIVFMGTPELAAGVLKALYEAGHEIRAVVTQPDKPKGRGKTLQMSPVKEFALEKGIEVFQPVRIRKPEAVEKLKEYDAQIFVVAAFGQILSQEILDMPPYGCINVHASLLPAYRGAAPIQWCIINGEEKTGVTIMQMDAGIDTGDMLLKKEVPILPFDTAESLSRKLEKAGGEAVVEALALLEKGELKRVPQDEEGSSYVSTIDKSLGRIDFSRSAAEIDRLIRGLNPWPSAYTSYKGKTLKIWEAIPLSEEAGGQPGSIERVEKDAVYVNTGKGILKVTQLQLEGKKRLQVKDFLLGCRMEKGEMLGC